MITPAFTNNSGSYSVVVSNAIGAVTSKVFVVTVSVDKTLPAVTITSPAAGARSNAPVTFSGTASEVLPAGNVLVTNVNYWITNLNGAPLAQGQARVDRGINRRRPLQLDGHAFRLRPAPMFSRCRARIFQATSRPSCP